MAKLLIADDVAIKPEAVQALNDQTAICEDVIGRYGRTNRVGSSGCELTVARLAACVMDELIQLDRHGIAELAALWNTERMHLRLSALSKTFRDEAPVQFVSLHHPKNL